MKNGICAHRAVAQAIIASSSTVMVNACGREAEDKRAPSWPQQAGQPLDPAKTAVHIVGAHVAAATGNQKGAETHVREIVGDMRRSARVPDVTRPINRESALAAVRTLPGVRSVIWMDRENLVVMVDGQGHHSVAKIDEVCLALEPLGDTLAVVVNVQDATATNGDEAMTLSRNCQLPEGQRAAFQKKRQVDVVDRETRASRSISVLKARQRAPVQRGLFFCRGGAGHLCGKA